METVREVSTIGVVRARMEESIEHAFAVGKLEQKEGIKTLIRKMMAGGLTNIVEQGHLNTHLEREVNAVGRSARFMDALARPVAG